MSIFEMARDDCVSIATHLLGTPNHFASSKHQIRWGSTGKLSLNVTGPFKGKWYNFSTGEHGDICDLVEQTLELERAGAIAWLKRWIGAAPMGADLNSTKLVPASVSRQPDAHRAAMAKLGISLFEGAPAVFEGTLGAAYLQGRLSGLVPPEIIYGGSLRFSSSHRTFLHRPVPGAIGAMLALMTDPVSAKPTGCHRTFISSDLTRICRGMLGGIGVVRLYPNEAITDGLSIGEGIETSISGHILFQAPPVWAALNAGNLSSIPALNGVQSLTIFVDNDENSAGQRGAAQCKERWLRAGAEVTSHIPRAVDTDFNNILEVLMRPELGA